jgi:hypothetical protein
MFASNESKDPCVNAFDSKFGSKISLRGLETVRKTHSSTSSSSTSSTSNTSSTSSISSTSSTSTVQSLFECFQNWVTAKPSIFLYT